MALGWTLVPMWLIGVLCLLYGFLWTLFGREEASAVKGNARHGGG